MQLPNVGMEPGQVGNVRRRVLQENHRIMEPKEGSSQHAPFLSAEESNFVYPGSIWEEEKR